jgi:hypothetical protein
MCRIKGKFIVRYCSILKIEVMEGLFLYSISVYQYMSKCRTYLSYDKKGGGRANTLGFVS